MKAKNNYFKDLMKNGYFLIALFVCASVFTALVASYELGLFKVLYSLKDARTFVLVLTIAYALIGIIYLMANLNSKKQSMADSFYLSMILIAICFGLFVLLVLKSFNARRLIFFAPILVLGLIFLAIRIKLYGKEWTKKEYVKSNAIKEYYANILNKFSPIALFICSAICICLSYLKLDSLITPILRDTQSLIIIIVCLLPCFIYGIKCFFAKEITAIDGLGFSCIIAFPLILVKIILLTYSPLKLALWAGAFMLFLICLFFRFNNYDSNYIRPQIERDENYIRKVFHSYSPLLSLSIGGLMAIVTKLIAKGDVIHEFLDNKKIVLSVDLLPMLVIILTIFLALAFFALLTLFGLGKKHVGINDFALSILVSFVIFGFISILSHPSPIMTYMLLAMLICSIIAVVIRSIVVKH